MAKKRVIAVLTFDDTEGNIQDLASAATWIEAGLSGSTSMEFDVTTYSTAADAAGDEAGFAGDFAQEAATVPFLHTAAQGLTISD
ncbi:hypothetical protein LJE71_11310 [Xanthobacter autotrophicus]|uniref:hypothetical protein n=1 Tax=Xanthobacter autotrophicus TaxID=280 RepID=UPI001E58D1C0|nr:hypothetical protein [Xanthobacter autotrophicus]UDQ91538.1 hypothetical protein LJE71_11310 [Xanthobacter autotrophicus]